MKHNRREFFLIAFVAICLLACCLLACSDDSTDPPDDVGLVEGDGSVSDAGDVDETGREPALIDSERAFELVDPFIGTGGLGFGYAGLTPAAQVPNGLVKLGPDSTQHGNHPSVSHFSGYHFDDGDVRGFSHLHLVGTGAAGLGNLRVLPVAEVDAQTPWDQYVEMDKATESARPGYYSVELPDVGVTAEMTATLRGGFHRYRATEDASGADSLTLLFNPASSVKDDPTTTVDMSVDAGTVEGSVVYSGDFATRSGPITLYFSTTTDPQPTSVSGWTEHGVQDGTNSAQGSKGGVVLGFDGADTVELRVGLSLVDLDQARLHRSEELDGRSFEEVRQAAKSAWQDKLGRVRLKGGSQANQSIFYTALYNIWRMPTRLDGADGRYRGVDDEIHQADGFGYYSDLSLWDTFRTTHPWIALVDPELARDCLKSLLAMKEQAGYIPRWPALQTFTGSMIGTPADQLFAEGALKGIDDVDYEAAFDALLDTATTAPPAGAMFGGRIGVERYVELGYVPGDEYDESVSRTLEFAWGDWSLANLADHLGRPEAEALRERAANWKKLFDQDLGFFVPRDADGTFQALPAASFGRDGDYTEGNAWHYRFYPIWQPDDLVAIYGGPESFYEPLSAFFENSGVNEERLDTTLPDNRYWHGNEHNLGAAYLFHFAGHPEDVGYWVRKIQTKAYNTTPGGLPGNDDGGTLSAWYLFSALGVSPVAGGDTYMLGAPLFPYAEVDVADGAVLVIEADGADVDTYDVNGVGVDGVAVDGPYLTHAELMGSTVSFEMAGEGLGRD
jgi:predicted alpha-1,2-mannosidase